MLDEVDRARHGFQVAKAVRITIESLNELQGAIRVLVGEPLADVINRWPLTAHRDAVVPLHRVPETLTPVQKNPIAVDEDRFRHIGGDHQTVLGIIGH